MNTTMLYLKEQPTIKDFQKYVAEMERERGFSEEFIIQKCLLLGEEVGELYKAVRKTEKIKVDENSTFGSVSQELSDVLIYLCAIANHFDIDLEKAFREKEELNKKRVWK